MGFGNRHGGPVAHSSFPQGVFIAATMPQSAAPRQSVRTAQFPFNMGGLAAADNPPRLRPNKQGR